MNNSAKTRPAFGERFHSVQYVALAKLKKGSPRTHDVIFAKLMDVYKKHGGSVGRVLN